MWNLMRFFTLTAAFKALKLKSCHFLMVLFIAVYSPLEKIALFYFTSLFDGVQLHMNEHLVRGNSRCKHAT